MASAISVLPPSLEIARFSRKMRLGDTGTCILAKTARMCDIAISRTHYTPACLRVLFSLMVQIGCASVFRIIRATASHVTRTICVWSIGTQAGFCVEAAIVLDNYKLQLASESEKIAQHRLRCTMIAYWTVNYKLPAS